MVEVKSRRDAFAQKPSLSHLMRSLTVDFNHLS
jgi:hypothetical protein